MITNPETIPAPYHDLVRAALDQPRPTPDLADALQRILLLTGHGARLR